MNLCSFPNRHTMCALACISLMSVAPACQAYDGFSSEGMHFLGGAVLAGGITALIESSPYRAWIGFGATSLVYAATEVKNIRLGGAARHSALLDIGWNAFGAAVGAFGTDRFLLKPVIAKGYVGVEVAVSY